MSKLIFKLYLILGISAIYSQTYEDALRYNQFYHEGSSRFNSMGGAFGALGGDLSSININPAGSSIFLKSELGFTLNFIKIKKLKMILINSSQILKIIFIHLII